jgi:hypothetical protein
VLDVIQGEQLACLFKNDLFVQKPSMGLSQPQVYVAGFQEIDLDFKKQNYYISI